MEEQEYGDTFNETIRVTSKPDGNDYATYKLFINEEKVKKANGLGVHLQIVDIDTSDNYKEIVFFTSEPNNVFSNFTIYRYDGHSCKKISKKIPSYIRRNLKIGNNSVSFINDSYVSSMGCYEYSEKYELENGILVKVNNTGVRQITGQTQDYKYKITSKLDLYKSYTSKSPASSIKAGTEIKIDRVYNKAFIKNKNSDKGTWARVKIKDKVAGWIKLPESSSDDNQIFENVPTWG